jgi:IclR family acetate operon transcriptional repressor
MRNTVATIATEATVSADPRQPSSARIESAQRSITILDALAESGELGTNELARRIGVAASTASRQLGTLAASGLVERVDATGRYRLGIRVVRLANAVLARLDVRAVAHPHLEELVHATGETATLSVAGAEDAVTVDFVAGAHSVQHVTQLGRPSIAHATSAGKVMLAFTDRPLPKPPLHAFTRRTITDPVKLVRELERVRRQGYAEANEERETGLSAIAAPVFGSAGELAGIVALQGPTTRFGRQELRTALTALLEHCAAISAALGSAVHT